MSGNVIELASIRPRPRRASPDKRVHPRVESHNRLFTQVVSAPDAPDLVGTTVSCSAVNMSIGGLQFRTQEELPVGTLLDLWVEVASRQGKFFLSGEVRWTRPGEPLPDGTPIWIVGVQLKTGAATDILSWRDYLANTHAT
jgi:Tfp pilus assembly protein PilZ